MNKFKEGQLVCLKRTIEVFNYSSDLDWRFRNNENVKDYVLKNEQVKFVGKKAYRRNERIIKKGTTAIVCGYFNILMRRIKIPSYKDLKDQNIFKFSIKERKVETTYINDSKKKCLVVLIDGKKVFFDSQTYFESSEQTLARKDVNIRLNCVFTIKNVTDKEIVKKQKSLINRLNKISTSCSLIEINEIKKSE